MKILSVEMAGFGPFKEPQEVDFSAFDDAGIFLIGGRTGAGKSTILDAISFALYASVPRYDGYSGGARLRSDHCEIEDVTRVTLTFEANDAVYRIIRNPEFERPKARGTGTTTEPASVELAVLGDRGWEGLETKIPEVARRISEIVKLDKEQFLQVILLAQNRFQEFLEADSKDRQGLLRTLFGTQRFEDYARNVNERAQTLGSRLQMLTQDADRTVAEFAGALRQEPPAAGTDRVAWARTSVTSILEQWEAAHDAESVAVQAAQAAAEALTGNRQLADRQQRLHDAQALLARLGQRSEDHLRNQRLYADAIRAAAVQARLRDAAVATQRLTAAQAEADAAGEAAGELPPSDLAGFVNELSRTLGALSQALQAEQRLPELTGVAARAQAALAEHDASVASIDDQRMSLRERLSDLEDRAQTATQAAGHLSGAQAEVGALQAAHGAATRLAAIDAELEQLKQAEIEALRDRTVATQTEERLRTLQLHGRAAVLAQTLVEGEPCPVCGAAEHPAPAELNPESVTDEQVDAARMRLDQARIRVDEAARRVRDGESRAAELRGAAGGRDLATLDRELTAAGGRLALAQSAQSGLALIAQERDQINAGLERLAVQERLATGRRLELAQTAALAGQTLAEAQELVSRSSDGFATVAARAQSLAHRQGALERLLAARAALANTSAAAAEARSLLEADLIEHGFADSAAAQAVALPEAQREQLAAKIREHEDGLTQANAVLAQPDLQELPADAADVAGATHRSKAADDARNAATERRVRLEGTARRARELTTKLEAELQSSADLEDEYKLINGLAGALRGDPPNQRGIPFESFVLAAELEEIVAAANGRLRRMSQGRYAIEHSDERTRGGKRTGLELLVYDAHTGVSRSPRSLSGGEKFLASLALALGLAEVVSGRAGGIELDTLFIDEGFGSLDSETLEVAMHTLDELRQGGRTVGLISHVEAMQDQIPARLVVDVADGGWSVIRQAA